MKVFEIKTSKSDYPFLVIAEGFGDAVDILRCKDIHDNDITSVTKLCYDSNHILIEERLTLMKDLRKEVRRELQRDMPRWMPEPDGVAGGTDRDLYLIQTSKGHYFTSKSIGGNNHYLVLEALEQLPGLPKEEG